MDKDAIQKRLMEKIENPVARFRKLAEAGPMNRRFSSRVKAKASIGELYLYDQIGVDMFGGIGAKDVIAALEPMKECKTLNIFVNSPGGDVFEATAIYNVLARHPSKKHCFIDGLAASAASYIPMVADKITTAHNAMWMIHNPWAFAMGEAADMRKAAEMLDQVTETLVSTYKMRTKQNPDQLKKWMDAETWMTAKDAKERGFTDEISGAACECSCDECQEGDCSECSCAGCPSCDDGDCEGCGGAEASMAFTLLNQYKNTPAKLLAQSSTQRVRLAEAEAYTLRLRNRASPGSTDTASRAGKK